ncbi:hypothetical protein CYMTET_18907 [Cymbomonas tetramitiformis]|uniref:Uncharacterized protein n=1 Tax=Cymbomonas tetramitiformis TaxID=36881 RepID=A0AAE0G793_9CHLO|nr:hypothetical protein CYMTET_18907 [Cymbomonas tetramitiformis]
MSTVVLKVAWWYRRVQESQDCQAWGVISQQSNIQNNTEVMKKKGNGMHCPVVTSDTPFARGDNYENEKFTSVPDKRKITVEKKEVSGKIGAVAHPKSVYTESYNSSIDTRKPTCDLRMGSEKLPPGIDE